jgi:hypothetical protein
MTAEEIVCEILRVGGRLEARGAGLHIEAPKGALSQSLKAALLQRKSEVLAKLTSDWNLDDWARLPLAEVERRHVAIQIRSDEYGSLWLVSTEAERQLADSGEPTYTVEEARRLIGLPEPLVRQIHEFKKTFGCELEGLQSEE